jgi:hypothetical protein
VYNRVIVSKQEESEMTMKRYKLIIQLEGKKAFHLFVLARDGAEARKVSGYSPADILLCLPITN